MGLDLTLRQVYYQFVSRDIFPDSWFDEARNTFNTQNNYKKLGVAVAKGRMMGEINWSSLNDRTRNLMELTHYEDPAEFVSSFVSHYNRDLWKDQPERVEVWIEKDALVGVIERYCLNNDIPYFSCRGYTSHSETWAASQRILGRVHEDDQATTILHLGDHDPSGLDMTRDIRDRLTEFLDYHTHGCGDIWLTVKRIALNLDQVRQFNPPPNPVKKTDKRFKRYEEETGLEESWELDALSPDTLNAIVREAVEEIRDDVAWELDSDREDQERADIRFIADRWPDVVSYIRGLNE